MRDPMAAFVGGEQIVVTQFPSPGLLRSATIVIPDLVADHSIVHLVDSASPNDPFVSCLTHSSTRPAVLIPDSVRLTPSG